MRERQSTMAMFLARPLRRGLAPALALALAVAQGVIWHAGQTIADPGTELAALNCQSNGADAIALGRADHGRLRLPGISGHWVGWLREWHSCTTCRSLPSLHAEIAEVDGGRRRANVTGALRACATPSKADEHADYCLARISLAIEGAEGPDRATLSCDVPTELRLVDMFRFLGGHVDGERSLSGGMWNVSLPPPPR